MITAEELIQQALGSTAGYIDRKKKARTAIGQGLQRVSNPSSPTGGGGSKPFDNEYGIDPNLLTAIQRMAAENPFGPDAISVGSGYRSIEEQAALYDRWRRGEYNVPSVAPPGRSNHNHGTAADLRYASDEVARWVAQNAARYGLHFPVRGENWHAELLGSR